MEPKEKIVAQAKKKFTSQDLRDLEKRQAKIVTDECYCAICFKIFFHATAANPCGHIFCRKCILCVKAFNKRCPLCRVEIKNTCVLPQLDNIVEGMVGKGDFPVTDQNVYFRRTGAKYVRDKVSTTL